MIEIIVENLSETNVYQNLQISLSKTRKRDLTRRYVANFVATWNKTWQAETPGVSDRREMLSFRKKD